MEIQSLKWPPIVFHILKECALYGTLVVENENLSWYLKLLKKC